VLEATTPNEAQRELGETDISLENTFNKEKRKEHQAFLGGGVMV